MNQKKAEKEWLHQVLPIDGNILETKPVLRKLSAAHRYLAELKGVAKTIPNESILINTLSLQEAKDSSEIENIVTTHDDLFQADLHPAAASNPVTKEVCNYAQALKIGFALVKKNGLLSVNHICEIQSMLVANKRGIRKLPGTKLKNPATEETVYVPPQEYDTIISLLTNLEKYINDDSLSDVDLLVKMAVIHFQFESIHPFYDGNGRTGRIINILYLVLKGLLDLPILYLSRYIIQYKADYYKLLRKVRVKGDWEAWILYVLDGVILTASQTIRIVENIRSLMAQYKSGIKQKLPHLYSQDLLHNIFKHPYTRIEFIQHDLRVNRATASKYLSQLSDNKFLLKQRSGRNNYYINQALLKILLGE